MIERGKIVRDWKLLFTLIFSVSLLTTGRASMAGEPPKWRGMPAERELFTLASPEGDAASAQQAGELPGESQEKESGPHGLHNYFEKLNFKGNLAARLLQMDLVVKF
ncbi:MAG: hypothetical protein C4576_24525 [Desulfobacteraceae bacterium]|nr:MAG: hypothetical protein C4576_24525 [Desulfobacteraceae bacterium]